MWRPFLVLSLLSLSAAGAQERLVRQAAPLPYVTLSAPGYSVRAEVRPAVVYPESGPNIGPYWQFSPAQVRVVLSPPGQPWKAQFPADMPPGYVTVTPVQNWLALYKGEARKEVTAELATLRSINAGKGDLKRLRREASLPYLPLMNAEQAVSGAVRRLNTAQLAGIRYLAVYAQDTGEYPRTAVFYTYQGLSRDGKFVVSVHLPYAPTTMPAPGQTRAISGAELPSYLWRTADLLDEETVKLTAFDRLVQSIHIR